MNPADVIYVGDNPAKDFQALRRLGIKSVWFKSTDGIYTSQSIIKFKKYAYPSIKNVENT